MTRIIISSMLAFLAATSPIQSANAQSGAVQVSTDSVEYPVQADSLKTLHFKELKYLLGKKWIQLQNGTYSDKYTIGSTDVSLEDFWLFDLRDGAPRHALVSIYSINCGGSCSPEGYALLFTIRSGKLVQTQEFYYDSQAPGTGVSFDATSNKLTITGRSDDSTPNCCPQNLDVVTYEWKESRFKFVGYTVKRVPQNKPKE
jgi:hypothetical protein